MIKIIINRIVEGLVSTLGFGTIQNGKDPVFNFVTLELQNNHNQINISSIPAITYKCKVINRPNNKGLAILLLNVPGRSAIEIHPGNFYSDIKGCILPGLYFKDINDDNYVDVAESTKAFNKIIEMCPDVGVEFTIEIKQMFV